MELTWLIELYIELLLENRSMYNGMFVSTLSSKDFGRVTNSQLGIYP